jgi:hypothetical protein
MAGNSAFASGFDEAGFRDAIKQTMRMGMPEDPAQRVTWHWKRIKTFTPQDRIKKPYNWTQTAVADDPGNPDEPDGELVVDYALEFTASRREPQTTVGQFSLAQAIVTVMDTDYELIKTADYATIGAAHYVIDYAGPPMGLFAVTVYQIYLRPRDEL